MVKAEIAAATKAANRPEGSVKLIAVSKTKPLEDIRDALATGQLEFGENKVQELVDKHAALPEVHWNMIGSLQRNKVKYIIPFIHLIHSVDSERLLAEIDRQAGLHGRVVDCLLQINISDEAQKGGFEEDGAEEILHNIAQYPHVRILGLMGMAAFVDDEAVIRQQFRRLALAGERFRAYENERVRMQELSMGMSGDFEIAIQEGSTMVRVGSSIFGGR